LRLLLLAVLTLAALARTILALARAGACLILLDFQAFLDSRELFPIFTSEINRFGRTLSSSKGSAGRGRIGGAIFLDFEITYCAHPLI
tara:strand:+ start:213 stop:476 length:264 start_codon:yes stop_codon:yes gene_type:complete